MSKEYIIKSSNVEFVNPKYVCYFDVIPNIPGAWRFTLSNWPSLRWRLFTWLFFGWEVVAIEEEK